MTKGIERIGADADLRGFNPRQKLTAAVLTRFSEIEELDDGYAFRYPRTAAWSKKLDAFTAAWSKIFPFMSFEVIPSDERALLEMEIRGPEGTKQWVEGARYLLTSNINPVPTFGARAKQALRYATSPLRVLPDFLIIGAKKCGTTALYSYLTGHPSIAAAYQKEIHYFNSSSFARGKAWYRAFFPTVFERQYARRVAGGDLLTGEATPDYLFNPNAPNRAHATVPGARLIAILRNPVDRAYSFYHHNLRAGFETLSFEEAIEREDERLAGEREKIEADPDYYSFEYEHHSYLTRGMYRGQLENWLELYPRERLLVLATEDLTKRPSETLRRSLDFLGLSYWEPDEFRTLNAAPYPDMDPNTRARLAERMDPYNQDLYEFLGTNLGWSVDAGASGAG